MANKVIGKKAKATKEAPVLEEPELTPNRPLYTPLDTSIVISTGSTLLDLAISGNRIHGGGLPGGIMVEIFGSPSCVDGDTEYLTPTGWKKISKYQKGESVLQYNIEDESAEFVEPIKYIKTPATEMYEFKNTYLNQCLSLNHTVVYRYRKRKKPVLKLPFSEVLKRQVENVCGFDGQFITGFDIKNTPGVNISDEYLRVMVMSIGDGSFDKRRKPNSYCSLNIKKERKINRARALLLEAKLTFKESPLSGGYTRFYYHNPTGTPKEFFPELYLCSQHQLKVIGDEAVHWDGNTRDTFYSTSKSSADFIQYAFAACGNLTHIYTDNRPDKPVTYSVSRRKNKYVSLNSGYNGKQKIYPHTPPDSLQYCFEVPSSCLVLRRKNKIFITGNSGKTALLVDICASAQAKGGEVRLADPEARLDKEYASLFGLAIPRDIYDRPNTVSELYTYIDSWEPKNDNVINVFGADSIAALSTDMEMGEGGDKRGQRKAKELSELCRKIGRKIAHKHLLVVFTNQERQGEYGKTTPGGFAVPYHASLRIRIAKAGVRQIEASKKKKVQVPNAKTGVTETKEVEFSKVIGIESEATIVKSSISGESQTAPLYIMYGRGIDDVRANLVWLKKALCCNKFPCVNAEYTYISQAVKYIEDNNLEADLRENVIRVWEDIDNLFRINRKKKVRF